MEGFYEVVEGINLKAGKNDALLLRRGGLQTGK
jgi:hypothetical protein